MTRQKTQLQNPTLLRFAALSEFNELEKVVKANKANKVGSMMIAALEHAKTEKECERTKEIVMKAMERYNSKSEFHAIKLSAIGASFNESVAERFASSSRVCPSLLNNARKYLYPRKVSLLPKNIEPICYYAGLRDAKTRLKQLKTHMPRWRPNLGKLK